MGRMKEIYIDLMNEYGEVPENFSYERWYKDKEITLSEGEEICSDRKEMDSNGILASEEQNESHLS